MAKKFDGIAHLVWFAGVSSGNDVIPPINLGSGEFILGGMNQAWIGLTVSYESGAEGAGGSLLNRTWISDPQGADAHLFGYYFTDSTGIHSSLKGKALVEQTPAQMGYGATSNPPDISGIDYGLGVHAELGARGKHLFFPRDKQFYFALTPASAQALIVDGHTNFARADPNGPVNLAPEAGVIYKMVWDPNAGQNAGEWGPPTVYRSRVDLGLQAAEYVDAIAVDPNTENTIFSINVQPNRPQLFINARANATSYNFELKDTGIPVARKIAGRDDVDNITGTCTIDPEGTAIGTVYGTTKDHFPAPVGGLLGDPVGISVTRTLSEVLVQVTGWGDSEAVGGWIELYYSHDYYDLVASPLQFIGTVWRAPGQSIVDLRLPYAPPPLPNQGTGQRRAIAVVLKDPLGNLTGTTCVSVFKD